MFDGRRLGEGAGWAFGKVFTAAWHAVGVVVFATLAILEPVVRYALSALASLGLAVTLVFGVLLEAPRFPTLFMFAMSVGCFVLLALYYWIMRCFGDLGDERRYP